MEIPIVHRVLGGKADLALKAFQLFIASRDLAHRAYIAPSDGRDFVDLLYAQVCGTEIHGVLQYVPSYQEIEKDPTILFIRLGGDVARYVTGNNFEASFYCAMLLKNPMLLLYNVTQIAIALASNDQEGANRLMEKGDRFIQ